jgi:hypothetical protein
MVSVRRRIARFASVAGLASILFSLLGYEPSFGVVRTDRALTRFDVAPTGRGLNRVGMVRTNPALYPAFKLSVVDYVNRCDPDHPTVVSVRAPAGTAVSVAGRPRRSGTFTITVKQQVNERFRIVVFRGGTRSIHNVRCLPLDFPHWSATRSGPPRARFYATTIIEGSVPNVPVIFDTNGVPVWWTERQPSFLLAPLPNGNLATLSYGGRMVERRLNGRPIRVLHTQGAPSDFHDVLLLPNGHYVLATVDVRRCRLSAWGLGRERCVFHEFQELTARGHVVWRWRPEDDIGIRQTGRFWRTKNSNGVFDPWHYNSVEWTGDGFIVSFRHMNAVYKIDYTSKDVVWKLGGSRRPRSLRVIGDPVFRAGGSFSGQHDARLVRPGVLSVFDNGTLADRAPRSVVYRIDGRARTATLVSRVKDRIARRSPCCGSTRVLPGGNRVTGWGGTPWITENKPDGTRVFRLNVTFVYRAVPIVDRRYTRPELRAAMDAQYRNGVFAFAAQGERFGGAASAQRARLDGLVGTRPVPNGLRRG